MTDDEFNQLGNEVTKLVPLFSKAIGEAADAEGVETSPAAIILSLALMMRSTSKHMVGMESEGCQEFCEEMLKVAFTNFT